MKQKRKKPEARKEEILAAALRIATTSHYTRVTRDGIGAVLGVSGPAISYHFKTMAQLRGDLMRRAVKERTMTVVAQGLLANDKHALKADEALKAAALHSAMVGVGL